MHGNEKKQSRKAVWFVAFMLIACGFVSALATPSDAFAVTKPAKATVSSVKAVGTTKAAVTVKKVSGARGYQIMYASNTKFQNPKSIWTWQQTKTITKLKPGAKYYVKVRAYKKTTSGKIIYGAWSKTKSVRIWYLLSYKLNGGNQAAGQRQAYTYYSKTFSLKAPTRKGYEFKGWYTSSSYKTKITNVKQGSYGNKTLYAKWSPKSYAITYELNGGTNSVKNPKSYTICSKSISLQKPSKQCCEFLGWFKDKACTKPFSAIPSGSTGSVVVYAKWKERHTPVWVDETRVEHVEEETYLVERDFDICNNPECPSYGLEIAPNHSFLSGLLCNTAIGYAKDTYLHHDAYDVVIEGGHCECAICHQAIEEHEHTIEFAGYVQRDPWTETAVHAGWWCTRCNCEVERLHPNVTPDDEMGHCSIWREDIVETIVHPAEEYELYQCADCGYVFYGSKKEG